MPPGSRGKRYGPLYGSSCGGTSGGSRASERAHKESPSAVSPRYPILQQTWVRFTARRNKDLCAPIGFWATLLGIMYVCIFTATIGLGPNFGQPRRAFKSEEIPCCSQ